MLQKRERKGRRRARQRHGDYGFFYDNYDYDDWSSQAMPGPQSVSCEPAPPVYMRIPVPVPVPADEPATKTVTKTVPVPVYKEVPAPVPVYVDTFVPLEQRFQRDLEWKEPTSEEEWDEYYNRFLRKFRSNQPMSPAVKTARLGNFKQSHDEARLQRAECNCSDYNVDSQMADLSPKLEFAKLTGINKLSASAVAAQYVDSEILAFKHNTPKSIDWTQIWQWDSVEQQLLSDQGETSTCGTSWAIALKQAMAASITLQTGYNVDLSAQSMLDCGHGSCSGWNFGDAAQFLSTSPYVPLREDYMYMAKQSGSCLTAKKQAAAFATKMVKIEPSVAAVIEALQTGPVVAAASAISWKTYRRGVHSTCQWNPNFLQAVLIVGYQMPTRPGGKDGFWKVRNSWGAGWGEDGYIRLAMGNTCGILLDVWKVEAIPSAAFLASKSVSSNPPPTSCSADSCSQCGKESSCMSANTGGPNGKGCSWMKEKKMCHTEVVITEDAPECGPDACFACLTADRCKEAGRNLCNWDGSGSFGVCHPLPIFEDHQRAGLASVGDDASAAEYDGSVSSCFLLECSEANAAPFSKTPRADSSDSSSSD